ncbi:site-specific integrase [Haloarcula sp. CBA1130]|uniref:tyrosine-type recombinase/integrase n=1 Tax=unclassified Haloarcula TaxID=2624677 RepID=UPI0012466C59|nr:MULTISPECIES: tyrosine-type recombinase/integrase [unclassified Haloarcula]KAA9398507.1 site-specific integrase [Haloarcula sp. CBA1129]KAA9401901.1 site-specific integrase [Haloarcula sp. CBA1130]
MSEQTIHRRVTVDQIDQMRDAAHDIGGNLADRNEVLVVAASDFGLRVGELNQLKRSHFRFDEGHLLLPADIQKKYPTDASPSSARMEIDPYGLFGTERLLKRYFNSDWWQAQDSEYVFPSRQSEQMTTESIRNVIRRLAVEADVSPRRSDGEPADPSEMHPHALRHSLASYMLQDPDTRLIDVRNRLRHRSIATTERIYEHYQER